MAVTSGLLFSSASFAGDFYVGGSIGQAAMQIDKDFADYWGEASRKEDDKDTAFGAFVGYTINEYFAAELSYFDLGKYEASTTNRSQTESTVTSAEVDLFEISAIGSLPLSEKFSLLGRAGYYEARAKASHDLNYVDEQTTYTVSGTNKTSGAVFGAGAKYSFTDNLSVRAEYRVFQDLSFEEKDNTDLLSVGLEWKF